MSGQTPASERLNDGLRIGGMLLALLLLGWGGERLRPALRPPVRGDAALNDAGWEGRRLAAQLLWVQTHSVLHAGAEEREARRGEAQSRAGEIHGHEGEPGKEQHADHPGHSEHEEQGEAGHVLVIPPKREDWRGILGDLERAVKPYAAKDGKLYKKDDDQTLPYYRLITWADPHFIQGYTVGAAFINRGGRFADRALAFLHEGERANPGSFEIQMELGHLYLVDKKDAPRAEQHLRRALELGPRDRELSELERDALLDAYRWMVLCYRKRGKKREEVAVAREGLARFGDDATLRHTLDGAPRQ